MKLINLKYDELYNIQYVGFLLPHIKNVSHGETHFGWLLYRHILSLF